MRALGLLCLLAARVAADPVDTGSRTEVVHERPGGPRMLFVPWAEGEREVRLLALPYAVRPAEEYDLVGKEGFIARVRVARVEETRDDCPSQSYERGLGDVIAGDLENVKKGGMDTVALGPTHGAPRIHAHLVDATDVDDRDLPPPGRLETLLQLADSDGDGQVDLARYVFDCAGGHDQMIDAGPICVEDWARGRKGWAVTGTARIACHDPSPP